MSFLDTALQAATQISETYGDLALRAARGRGRGRSPEAEALASLATQGMGGEVGKGQQSQSLQHHQEQYRHNSGWNYAAIRVIANWIARQPLRVAKLEAQKQEPSKAKWHLYPSKKVLPGRFKTYHQNLTLVEDHPFLEVMNLPNEVMTRWQLMTVSIFNLQLTGRCYWWMYDPGKDSPLHGRKVVWPVPSHWIEPKHVNDQDKPSLFDHYEIKPEGTEEPVVIPSNQIVYFFYPDPANPLSVMSPLQAAARSVTADEAIQELQRRVFLNDINPGLALIAGRHPEAQTPGSPNERPYLSREQRAQLLYSIKQAYRGVQNYGEPLILDAMITDVKRLGNSPRELDFMKSGQYTKERVTQNYGVNPIVMGQVEGVNRASSAVADDHLAATTVNPTIAYMSEVLTHVAFPLFLGLDKFAQTGYLAYIEEAQANDPDQMRADRAQLLTGGGISINEHRQQQGLPPVWGGDICLVPATSGPMKLVREDEPEPDGEQALYPGEDKPRAPAAPPPGKPMPGKPASESGNMSATPQAPSASDTAKNFQTQTYACWARSLSRVEVVQLCLKSQSTGEQSLRPTLVNWFAHLAMRVRDALTASPTAAALNQAVPAVGTGNILRQILLEPLLHLAQQGAQLEWALHAPRRRGWKADPTDLGSLSGAVGGTMPLPDATLSEIQHRLNRALAKPWYDDLVADVRTQLGEALASGIESGMAPTKLVDWVSDVVGPARTAGRVKTTVRTETARATNAGHHAARQELAEMGLVKGKTWLGIADDLQRETHAEADGQTVGVDEKFIVGDEECDYPCDDSLSAGESINCRCICVSRLIGEDIGKNSSRLSWKEICRDEGGRFSLCGDNSGTAIKPVSKEHEASFKQAVDKIKNAPVPSEAAVAKARADVEKSRAQIAAGLNARPGGASVGNAADRRKQRENLFKEFGGDKKGYVSCPGCGCKCHHTDDKEANPNGYPKFERDKVFTKVQGGGYTLPNLIPKCFSCNRSRNDRPIRPENLP